MDKSHHGSPAQEWVALAESLADVDINQEGHSDAIRFPGPSGPLRLRAAINANSAAASASGLHATGLDRLVTRTDFLIPVSPATSAEDATIPLRLYRHADIDPTIRLPALLYLHGGGMLFGTLEGEDLTCSTLASSLRCSVLNICYRHTPEATFPTQPNDGWTALEWIHGAARPGGALPGIDPNQLVVAGVSAGGNLAAGLTMRDMARAKNDPLQFQARLRGQVLGMPWLVHRDAYPFAEMGFDTDDSKQNCSVVQCAAAPILPKARYDLFTDLYCVPDPHDTSMSVALAGDEALEAMPRTALLVAGWDMLRDEAYFYADKLERVGVVTKKHIFPGLPHGFPIFPQLPSRARWLDLMAESVRWVLDEGAAADRKGEWRVEKSS